MARLTVQQRTMRRARECLGTLEQLARALVVPMATLERWLDGTAPIPAWAFLRAVDIVNDTEDKIYAEMLAAQQSSNDPAAAVPYQRKRS